MSKRLTLICIFSLVLGAFADASAASTIKITCSGNLTNTRADGVTLGQCDLNFISVKQMDEIQTICGITARLTRPLKINAEYERLFRPIQFRQQTRESYTKLLKCGR